jgi:hypothetical protein
MIIIQDKIISDELVEEQFLCNLDACKGACCWEGDAGAPLEQEELALLAEVYPAVSPYLSPAGRAAIAEQGLYVVDKEDGEYRTPLIDNAPCAYMTLTPEGKAQCGIEQAWQAGDISFQKPISCHLYPVRVTANEISGFEALNYDRWDICSAACDLGEANKLPVYRFVKNALIRKYGEAFYEELDHYATQAPDQG